MAAYMESSFRLSLQWAVERRAHAIFYAYAGGESIRFPVWISKNSAKRSRSRICPGDGINFRPLAFRGRSATLKGGRSATLKGGRREDRVPAAPEAPCAK